MDIENGYNKEDCYENMKLVDLANKHSWNGYADIKTNDSDDDDDFEDEDL